jgi:hypothetical protein
MDVFLDELHVMDVLDEIILSKSRVDGCIVG